MANRNQNFSHNTEGKKTGNLSHEISEHPYTIKQKSHKPRYFDWTHKTKGINTCHATQTV